MDGSSAHPEGYKEYKERNTDSRTNEELFLLALNDDDEIAWEAITELQRRGNRDIFEQAHQFCISSETKKRRVGADILGQLGLLERPFHEEIFVVLLAMLQQEQESEVLKSVAVALGHRNDPRAIKALARLKHHPDEAVRFGMVFGLMGYEDELAIQTLIECSTDIDVDVRDWATFALGSQIELDTLAIREALLARLNDTDENTRSEAIVGLAQRGDPHMVEPLIADLEQGWISNAALEAAAEIGDPRLYPILQQLQLTWADDNDEWLYKRLLEAIESCRPVQK
ncbi:HEAT repeat domain-containing protein [Dictyobacter kobayashii]|uniref:Phycocyanobilin lyase n=1 Tax=Dictyobacter kobayashii TaxID=2014872 RepID=A0A402ATY7_9CHLR|nr:HEAT repeat domain-containing protein [Dictyobacter kobayashii]GCE22626.1 hypothetical protein KDK_64260 [Dictyobacter kobayashii]